MMLERAEVAGLLDQFRASRRRFEERVSRIPQDRRSEAPDDATWSARDLVTHVAAWLSEANDRLPRALAGAPPLEYDVDAFNAAAVERAAGWSADQAIGAFRRAADRFDVMVADMDPADLLDSDEAMRWLRSVAGELMDEHVDDLDRLARKFGGGTEERRP